MLPEGVAEEDLPGKPERGDRFAVTFGLFGVLALWKDEVRE